MQPVWGHNMVRTALVSDIAMTNVFDVSADNNADDHEEKWAPVRGKMSLGLRTSSGVNWTPNLGLESSLAGVLTISSSNQQQSFFGTKQCEAFLQFPESILG